MSQYALRIPESLFKQAKILAAQENTSLNQLFITAIAEKLSAIATEDFLTAKAKSADKQAYLDVLKKVRDSKPRDGD